MDLNEYRKRGKEMVDYIADYLETIRDRRVYPNVKPGYMRNLVPDSAPVAGEDWSDIFRDVERVIMPGVTHWQSPHMHAYFPALNSFPSLLGDMLADAINCLGFTWASSPACTELETIVMNWLGKMIGLPEPYLHSNSASKGGGVIQTTASESTLVCLLAGRTQAIQRFHEHTPGLNDAEINAKLVAYCSDQAHSSVEKAALIGLVRMRYIESDENLSLRGPALRAAIEDDIKLGLVPFWVCATLGTTGACSFDNLDEITDVCLEHKMWVHVDAAYAGSSFVCPEHRGWLKGVEKADSIAFNPSKWLMVHFDCTALWVQNSGALHRTFNVEPLYLQHENSGLAIDYMHWQIPLSKRFRALKLWFVIRNYGITGLQCHIREGVRLAQKFEALVLADPRFEIPATRHLGMVVFRIKGENELTERLLKRLNHRGKLHCVPSSLKGKYVIRFTVTSTRTTVEDICTDWQEIRLVTAEILAEHYASAGDRARVTLKETRELNEAFGSSLLLANTPMSPKIVNGSFVAICDSDDAFVAKDYAGIRMAASQNSPAMRRRVRGILMSGKQFSLDSRIDLVIHSLEATHSNRHGSGNDDTRPLVTEAIAEDVPDREAYEYRHLVIQPRKPPAPPQRPRSLQHSTAANERAHTPQPGESHPVPTNSPDTHHAASHQHTASPTKHTASFPVTPPHLKPPPLPDYRCDQSNPASQPPPPPDFPAPQYAFYNRGFDVHHKRAREQHHSSPRSHTPSGLANITEFEYEDVAHWATFAQSFRRHDSADRSQLSLQVAAPNFGESVPTPRAVPNFKVRISDEWGRRINSIESPGSDLFDEWQEDAEAGGSSSSGEEAFGWVAARVQAGGDIQGSDDGRPKCCAKCSRKCGGNELKLQFSSSFE